ncbi:putative transcriptional regulatory protein C139,03 [Talaromyces islandicus]|uniref:Putative transcriptional regulatory protein C139,03 n=1 Tax=Talaromyces islandicus TaxID=28573 RepID=A0A0U1LTE5_TALIS|nr:putative transcriptional regulatory protein C139,03 [Talaromyces islandicus]
MEDSVQEINSVNTRGKRPSHAGKLCFRDAQARYIRETFWAGLYEEVENLTFLLDKATSGNRLHDTTPLFAHTQQSLDFSMYATSRKGSDFLIDHFLSNIDPFIRLFHKPRFRLDLDQFYRQEVSFVSQRGDFETLLFSIFAFSVHSLHEEDTIAYFGETKDVMVGRFIVATQKGLEKINILSTHSLTALTAFALHITLLSEIDSSDLEWTSLSGLSLSIATRLGLHKDGEQFTLSPYAVEIRRRLWHHLCLINVRALQIHGIEPFPVSAFVDGATKLPQNSPDNAWDACEFSRKLPVAVSGWTEMVPALLSFELSTLTRAIFEMGIPEHGSESMYLTKCDQMLLDAKTRIGVYYSQNFLDEPIHKIMKDLIVLNLQNLWFIARQHLLKHRTWATRELHEELFRKALHISEITRSLKKVYAGQHWDWVFHSFYETTKWYFASTMLIYLRNHTEQEDPEVQRAWTQVKIIFNQQKDGQGALWKPLLALKREAELRRDEVTGEHRNGDGPWQAPLLTIQGADPMFAQWGVPGLPLSPDSDILGKFYNPVLGEYGQSG